MSIFITTLAIVLTLALAIINDQKPMIVFFGFLAGMNAVFLVNLLIKYG